MLSCHLIKNMMVMTRATLMSPRLCWWGTALIFNRFCSGCDLLVISCRVCVKTRLCLLGEALFCSDQAAENNVSSVKATLSKGGGATRNYPFGRHIGILPPCQGLSPAAAVWPSCCSARLAAASCRPGPEVQKRHIPHAFSGGISPTKCTAPCR